MNRTAYLLLGVVPLLASCASPTLVSDTVGPNPFRARNAAVPSGYLRVFSQTEPVTEGFDEGANPTYYQHSDYRIYDNRGKLVKYVGNTIGEYSSAPRLVSLPPGAYIVKARAKDFLLMNVPVLIEPGRTTNVHLDDQWNPPATANSSEIVKEPSGSFVGWRASVKTAPGTAPGAAGATAG